MINRLMQKTSCTRSAGSSGYEFEFNSQKFTPPKDFLASYQGSTVELITRENYLDFVS